METKDMDTYAVLLVDDEEEVIQVIMKKSTGKAWASQSSDMPTMA